MIVGAAEEAIRRPGAIAFGEIESVANSRIALLRRKPHFGTTKPLPNSSPSDVVIAAMLPFRSTIVKCVVCMLSATADVCSVSDTVGVTCAGSIEARHCAA